MTATAYSYVRFSTPEQRKGDSLRRQLAAAKEYADAHGLKLDDTLRDEGISARKGANRTKGALGAFLKKVESGDVVRGSVLIVEALDRLTREDVVEAHYLFLSIIRAGITVVTLIDGMEYVPGKVEPYHLINSITKQSEAGQFSEKLSYRITRKWADKVEQARQWPERAVRKAPR
jgi:Resolvase, N terminal domain